MGFFGLYASHMGICSSLTGLALPQMETGALRPPFRLDLVECDGHGGAVGAVACFVVGDDGDGE
jgi:hypothetical protein